MAPDNHTPPHVIRRWDRTATRLVAISGRLLDQAAEMVNSGDYDSHEYAQLARRIRRSNVRAGELLCAAWESEGDHRAAELLRWRLANVSDVS